MIDSTNFYEVIREFELLPGAIENVSTQAFQTVYGSPRASLAKGIVYLFLSAQPIPRLVGESRIIYIGQTKGSFKNRYFQYSSLHASSKANKLKFEAIIREYGPITIAVCPFKRFGSSLLEAEGQLLWWYFQNHCEYPPVNYTKTKVRNDAVQA
ncbi:MAG: hypothetical protein ACTIDY_10195 [Halomonadaceae bacterium]|uniref:GIY-YIG domain-containing protein n=1 Tax=Halomonas colorata TaxID=2742615 RepID=A0ABR9G383_9GAMM|nr:hypothetical protein [Halomonas colorata]MBE0465378.1 hypothetical protein [Halomonas colorata]